MEITAKVIRRSDGFPRLSEIDDNGLRVSKRVLCRDLDGEIYIAQAVDDNDGDPVWFDDSDKECEPFEWLDVDLEVLFKS